MVQKIVSGEVKLAKDETIKLVGHSQGAAHAAGMAKALQDAYESGTINNKVEQIFYLAPHQPMSIETPAGIFSIQYSRRSDKVSSRSIISTKGVSGGSEFGGIQGVSEFVELGGMNTNRGGHDVETYGEIFDRPQGGQGGVAPTAPDNTRP